MGITNVSDSGGPRFKSEPQDRLSWLKFFAVFFRPNMQILKWYFKLGHHIISYPFQFKVHWSSHQSTPYSLELLRARSNEPQINKTLPKESLLMGSTVNSRQIWESYLWKTACLENWTCGKKSVETREMYLYNVLIKAVYSMLI